MPGLRHAIALFLATYGAIGVHPVAAAQPAPQVIRVGVSSAPRTLDPALATDAAGARLLQLTHPALLGQDASLTPPGLVAQGCAFQGPQAVVCTLRPNVTYSDGAPLTAASVATWLTQVQRNGKSALHSLLTGATIAAPDAQTVTFGLRQPTPGFLAGLAQIPLADPANPAAGAGAYRLGRPDAQGTVTLTPRDSARPALQFIPLADPTTRLLKLQKGELDVLQNDLPPELLTYARDKHLAVLATPGSAYTYVAYNFRNDDLANPRWREALARSVNRAQIRQALLAGQAAPAGSLLPPGGPATWEAPEEPYQPQTVADELDESLLPGPDGTRVAFTLTTSTDPTAQRLAQILQQQWAQIGVRVDIRPTEWAALYDAVKAGRFDMVLMTWTGLQTPDFLYTVFEGKQVPPAGFNRGHVNDEALNQTLDALHSVPTAAQQTALAIAAQKQIAALRPYLPLFRRHQILVMGKNVTGCTIDMPGSYAGLTTCVKK